MERIASAKEAMARVNATKIHKMKYAGFCNIDSIVLNALLCEFFISDIDLSGKLSVNGSFYCLVRHGT